MVWLFWREQVKRLGLMELKKYSSGGAVTHFCEHRPHHTMREFSPQQDFKIKHPSGPLHKQC